MKLRFELEIGNMEIIHNLLEIQMPYTDSTQNLIGFLRSLISNYRDLVVFLLVTGLVYNGRKKNEKKPFKFN